MKVLINKIRYRLHAWLSKEAIWLATSLLNEAAMHADAGGYDESDRLHTLAFKEIHKAEKHNSKLTELNDQYRDYLTKS